MLHSGSISKCNQNQMKMVNHNLLIKTYRRKELWTCDSQPSVCNEVNAVKNHQHNTTDLEKLQASTYFATYFAIALHHITSVLTLLL